MSSKDNRRGKSTVQKLLQDFLHNHTIAVMVAVALIFLVIGIGAVSIRSSRIVNLRMDDIGELVTQAGYFTNVQVIENNRELWGISIPFTQSKYIFSYDGIVKAGIDFAEIDLHVDELTQTITIKMPSAKIISNEVATDSLEVYDESRSAFSPLKLADINESLTELKREVEENAIANGILNSATSNAQMLVTSFLAGMFDLTQYELVFK
ncbi:MAG: DUF4230 domain-containing protein [Clostridia bacterium]|nr:DUF4230 domain-containing protein [Clostridia bacterium]